MGYSPQPRPTAEQLRKQMKGAGSIFKYKRRRAHEACLKLIELQEMELKILEKRCAEPGCFNDAYPDIVFCATHMYPRQPTQPTREPDPLMWMN